MITWQMQFTIRQFLSAEKCVLTWAKGWWRIKTWYVVTLPILVTDDRYSLCWWQVQDICDWLYDKVNNITLVTVPCRSSSSRKLFFPTHLKNHPVQESRVGPMFCQTAFKCSLTNEESADIQEIFQIGH